MRFLSAESLQPAAESCRAWAERAPQGGPRGATNKTLEPGPHNRLLEDCGWEFSLCLKGMLMSGSGMGFEPLGENPKRMPVLILRGNFKSGGQRESPERRCRWQRRGHKMMSTQVSTPASPTERRVADALAGSGEASVRDFAGRRNRRLSECLATAVRGSASLSLSLSLSLFIALSLSVSLLCSLSLSPLLFLSLSLPLVLFLSLSLALSFSIY